MHPFTHHIAESPSSTELREFRSQRTRRQSISAENYDPSDDAELTEDIKVSRWISTACRYYQI